MFPRIYTVESKWLESTLDLIKIDTKQRKLTRAEALKEKGEEARKKGKKRRVSCRKAGSKMAATRQQQERMPDRCEFSLRVKATGH